MCFDGVCFSQVFTRRLATDKDVQENIKNFKEGKFDKMPDPTHLEHFR